MFVLSLLCDLQQCSNLLIFLGETSKIRDLFLTFNPFANTAELFSPLGSSDDFISVICPVAQVWPLDPSSWKRLWHYKAIHWESLPQYVSEISWNDYCFRSCCPSVCAEQITAVIHSGMGAYIPHFFCLMQILLGLISLALMFYTTRRKPTDDFRAIHLKNFVHCMFLPGIWSLFPSTVLSDLNAMTIPTLTPGFFWHLDCNLSKNFSASTFLPLIRSDCCCSLFIWQKWTFGLFLPIHFRWLWCYSSITLPFPPPLFMPIWKFLLNTVFYASLTLGLWTWWDSSCT